MNTGTVTTRLTTTSTATMRITRRRGSRSAGASWPSDSRPENASHAAANPVAVSGQWSDDICFRLFHSAIQCSSGTFHNTATTSAAMQASAASAIASARRGSSRTPTQCRNPSRRIAATDITGISCANGRITAM